MTWTREGLHRLEHCHLHPGLSLGPRGRSVGQEATEHELCAHRQKAAGHENTLEAHPMTRPEAGPPIPVDSAEADQAKAAAARPTTFTRIVAARVIIVISL